MKQIFIFMITALLLSGCETTTTGGKGIKVVPANTPVVSINSKKLALVIGNRQYKYGVLTNTVNDAKDVARVLGQIGFEVILKTDLDRRAMNNAIHDFGQRLKASRSSIGWFYYSGHGARGDGENYLLPIDNGSIRTADDLQYEAVPASRVLQTMNNAKTDMNIIVLDACRDQPYRSIGKNASRGLNKMQNQGSIIAFATADGDVAADVSRNGRNGLFTSHLISALSSANKTHQRIDDMFMQVRSAVLQESRGKQEPWYNASLRSPFCFGGCQVANVVPQPKPIPASKKVFQDRLRDGSLGPKMVRIPAGSFRMGDIQGGGFSDEKPVHRVSVGKFAMGMYEVTLAEYNKFAEATGRTKHFYWRRGNRPVINVSWNDATAYTKWLSNQTGKNYRLPTEAEWEYAARAGTETKYWWGNEFDKNKANCGGHSGYYCRDSFTSRSPVGSFSANKFGLYDTSGNVSEWTCSEYEKQYNDEEKQCVTTEKSFCHSRRLVGPQAGGRALGCPLL
jgi:formylglycine-generating enzyme required for sulfatase activity/predicted small secreted protein